MRRQYCQHKDDKGDIGPLQLVEISHVVGIQDAQRQEEHPRLHGLVADKQQQDTQQHQVIGHGDLGAYRDRPFQRIMMWHEQWDEQHQHHKAQHYNLEPSQPFGDKTEANEVVGIRLPNRQQITL